MGLVRALRRQRTRNEKALAKKRRRKALFEPLEPRILLSADSLLPGLSSAVEAGLTEFGDQLEDSFDADAYDTPIPGVLQTTHDIDDDGDLDDQDIHVPDITDALSVNVDRNLNGSITALGVGVTKSDLRDVFQYVNGEKGFTPSLEQALSAMDLDSGSTNDNIVTWREMYDVLVVGATLDWLAEYDHTLEANDEIDELENHLRDFLAGLVEPSAVNSVIDLDLTGVSDDGSSDFFGFTFDLGLTVKDQYLIDLGLEADTNEIIFPETEFTAGGNLTDVSPAPEVQLKAKISVPMSFYFDVDPPPDGGDPLTSSDFNLLINDDIVVTADIDESLEDTVANVGFLGTEVPGPSGDSSFVLHMEWDVTITDPSSPIHLGFTQSLPDTSGSFELTADTALPNDPGTPYVFPQNVFFELTFGTNALSHTSLVTVTASSTTGNLDAEDLRASLQEALEDANLDGILKAELTGSDHLRLTLADAADAPLDITPLGFTDNDLRDGAAPYTLIAPNDSSLLGLTTAGQLITFLLSYANGIPKLVNVTTTLDDMGTPGDDTDDEITLDSLISDINTALAAAGLDGDSLGDVWASESVGGKIQLNGNSSIEVTRTLEMDAQERITFSELSHASFGEFIQPVKDSSNDSLVITMPLDVRDGVDFSPSGDPGIKVDEEPFSFSNSSLTTDSAGVDRLTLTLTDLSDNPLALPGSDFLQYLDFNVVGPGEALSMIQQLATWLQQFRDTDMLGSLGIPFAEEVAGKLAAFDDMILDTLLVDDNDTNDDDGDDTGKLLKKIAAIDPDAFSASFGTAQELGARLDNLGLLTLTGSGDYADYLEWDPVEEEGRELTYQVSLSHDFLDLDVPVNFNLDLAPVGSIFSESTVHLAATGYFDAILGITMGPGKIDDSTVLADLNGGIGISLTDGIAFTGAEDARVIEGRLTADATFTVQVTKTDDSVITAEITVPAGSTSAFTDTSELITLMDGLLPGSISGLVEVQELEDRIQIVATDSSVKRLEVTTSTADPAYSELGLPSTLGSSVYLWVEPSSVKVSGSVTLDFFLNGNGTAEDSITLLSSGGGTTGATGANNTLSDLVNDINALLAESDLEGRILAARSGNKLYLTSIDASIKVFRVSSSSADAGDIGFASDQLAGVFAVAPENVPDPLGEIPPGRLSGSADFTVSINGGAAAPVSVSQASADTNKGIEDLVGDINAVLPAGIIAEVVGTRRIGFRASDESVQSFEITATSTAAEVDLGLGTDPLTADGALRVGAIKDAPRFYGPETDAHFTVDISGGPQDGTSTPVTLETSETWTNRTIADLAGDLRRALNTAFGGASANPLQVSNDGSRLLLTPKSGSGVTGFDITANSSDSAITDLKLYQAGTTLGGAVTSSADSADILIYTDGDGVKRVDLNGLTTIGDLKGHLNGLSGNPVTLDINDIATGLTLVDNTDTAPFGGDFRVDSVNGSKAAQALGLFGSDRSYQNPEPDGQLDGTRITTLQLVDRFFLREVDDSTKLLRADLTLTTPDSLVLEANFGFVGVKLTGDADPDLSGEIAVGLESGHTTNVRLSDLLDALSNDEDGDGDIDVFDLAELVSFPTISFSGDLVFGVELLPDISEITGVGGSSEITFSLLGAGNPFQLKSGATGPYDVTDLVASDLGDPDFADTLPDVDVNWTDLGDLANFENITFDNVLEALKSLRDFLDDFADLSFLGEEIPLIGVSFNDLVGIAERFSAAVDEIEQNPAGAVQTLEQKIRETFGLPAGGNIFDLELVDNNDGDGDSGDMLKISLNLPKNFNEALSIDLDLSEEYPELPFSLLGTAGLNAGGNLTAKFAIGVNLDDPTNPDEIVLFTDESDTSISADLDASANNVTFNASLGTLGVFIQGGSASVDLEVGFENTGASPGDRTPIAGAFAGFTPTFSGNVDAVLPVFFPTQSTFVGDIEFGASLALVGGSLDITGTLPGSELLSIPTDIIDLDFENFSLLGNLPLLIDAGDLFLSTIQDVMDGQIFNFKLPLIGDKLSDAARFIQDFREDFIQPFRDLVEAAPEKTEDLIQTFLFNVLEPTGLLKDSNSSGTVTKDDIIVTGDPFGTETPDDSDDDFVQFDFVLGQEFSPDVNIDFDMGFPGLSLDVDAELGLTMGWELGLGLGISLDDGAYINIARDDDVNKPELTVYFDAILGGGGITGTLGFLQLVITPIDTDFDGNGAEYDGDTAADPTKIHGEFGINLENSGNTSDTRLSFYELGSLNADVGVLADAEVNLDVVAQLDPTLVPSTIAAALPSVSAQFVLNWEVGNKVGGMLEQVPLTGGGLDLGASLKLVEFRTVTVDLGSFLGDTVGPVIDKIQEVTGPIQPIIDIVTAPIPVLSDLAGRDITLLDLAGAFGDFDPSLIYAIADIISLANSIDTGGGSSLGLVLGDFTLVDADNPGASLLGGGGGADLAGANFDFGGFSDNDLKSVVKLPDGVGALGDLTDPGVLDSFLGGASGTQTAETTKSLFSGGFSSSPDDSGFDFPIFTNPAQIFGLLLGRPAVIVTYDLPPFLMDFRWEQSFQIYGPLWGVVAMGIGLKIDLAFGYDAQGIFDFAEGGFTNPLDLLSGFFISDTNMPDGSFGVDVPELVFSGSIGVGAELNAGIASAGVIADIILTVNFDLYDPDRDGKVRLEELLGTFLFELKNGDPALAPISIFDVFGDVAFQLSAYIKFLVAKFDFEITPPIVLFEFSIPFDREPILATERGDGSVLLNMGPNASSRLNGDIRDINETFFVKDAGTNEVAVWAPDLGVDESAAQIYSIDPGKPVVGFGGEGNDKIDASGLNPIPASLVGGVGNDTLIGGAGNDTIEGDLGDDSIEGNAGDDTITGGEGNDDIDGGADDDVIFADTGSISDDATYGSIRGFIGLKDGNDTVSGGTGSDSIFGGGGEDELGGDVAPGTLDGGSAGDNDFIFGDGGRIATPGGTPSFGKVPQADGTIEYTGITLTDLIGGENDTIRAHGGDDVAFGGRGNDSIDGGAEDDTLFGGPGFDTIAGGGDADHIEGGTEDDRIFGFRDENYPGSPDGADVIFGQQGNDFIRGNGDDDTIEGNAGADIIFGDFGDDTIYGQNEPDLIFGGPDRDYIEGGTGNDIVFGDDGFVAWVDFNGADDHRMIGLLGLDPDIHEHVTNAQLDGLDSDIRDDADSNSMTLDLIKTLVSSSTDGNDTVIGGEGEDFILGGADSLFSGTKGDTLFGDFDPGTAPGTPPAGPIPANDDILIGDGGRIEFQNRRRENIRSLPGTNSDEVGDDTILGNGGKDVLLGGGASDLLYGRMDDSFTNPFLEEDAEVRDDDIIISDDGEVDYITIDTTTYLERIETNQTSDAEDTGGEDTAYGNKHDDIIFGGMLGDTLAGDTGDDVIVGDQGRILFSLGLFTTIETNDATSTVGGVDVVDGDDGNDVILGGVAGDSLNGNLGTDILVGDEGRLRYDLTPGDGIDGTGDDDPLTLDLIETHSPSLGGSDTIRGNADADTVLGGTAGDTIVGDLPLDTGSAGPDVLIGDQGEVLFLNTNITRVRTTDTAETDGGSDTINGNADDDIILGGVEGDLLRGDEESDIILGDEGLLRWDVSTTETPPAGSGDDNILTLDLIETTEFTLGGVDTIEGNAADDTVMGGTDDDYIAGDNNTWNAVDETFDSLEGSPGDDVLFGDQGRMTFQNTLVTRIVATDTAESDGGSDVIEGNDLEDIILGGVQGDLLRGEAKDTSLVGGSGTNAGDDIILGDEGLLRWDVAGPVGDDDPLTLDLIETGDTSLGDADTIFGNGGDDTAMGGTAGDEIYGDIYDGGSFTVTVDPGLDILLGDGGHIEYVDTDLTLIRTKDPGFGGSDTIEGNEKDDTVVGGYADDLLFGEAAEDHLDLITVDGGAGDDVILGDNGRLDYILADDTIEDRPDVEAHLGGTTVTLDPDPANLDRITTTDPTLGGNDVIYGNGNSSATEGDSIFGGTGSDTIRGDTSGIQEPEPGPDGPDGKDLAFGDHGKIYPSLPDADAFFLNNNFFSIDTQEEDLGAGDVLFGNANNDILIGGQGDDVMFGGKGDDDMIGGHNVEDGDDDLDDMPLADQRAIDPLVLADLTPADVNEINDIMDGGKDDDVMAGDNAYIIRQTDVLSPRYRQVGESGEAYNLLSDNVDGLADIDVGFEANVTEDFQPHQEMTLVRTVFLLNHDEATEDAAEGSPTDPRPFGNDIMAGGTEDDEMFGQLGDDVMQGDGEIEVIEPAKAPAAFDEYNPAQDADPSFDLRNFTIEVDLVPANDSEATLRFSVFEDLADGDDYEEGNGGNDRMYGNLGQDDLIGGSSTLFGLDTNAQRPDGADLIYGGAGNPSLLERNASFGGDDNDISGDTIVPDAERHATDADSILGDNGDIFRLVKVVSEEPETIGYESFAYDYDATTADGFVDDGFGLEGDDLKIRPRAVSFADYSYEYVDHDADPSTREVLTFLSTARGEGDLIYGESGDDTAHGMTGNDVIFGNSEHDDLYGEIGTDFLLGGTGVDGIVGDDGLILTSRNDLTAEPLYDVLARNPDQGPLKNNEEVDLLSLNAEITTPGDLQRAIINVEGELVKAVELFAFRTDDLDGETVGEFGDSLRFNDIIFGGQQNDFIHSGDGDDAISGAEALETYYSGVVPAEYTGPETGFTAINLFLQTQQNEPVNADPDVADNPFWFDFAPYNPGEILRYEGKAILDENGQNARTRDEFALYDEFEPRKKVMLDELGAKVQFAADAVFDFLLNFDETEGPDGYPFEDDDAPLPTDGDDRIFGDAGNDWAVGGTGRDHMYGGRGDDLLNMDDNHNSGPGGRVGPHDPPQDDLDNTQSDEFQAYADIVYSGAGRDIMILNTGADRATDWVGEFNSYIVPFSPFGAFHISRTLQPQLPEFVLQLSFGDGIDARVDDTLQNNVPDAQLYVDQKNLDVRVEDPAALRNFEPYGELGMVLQTDYDWQEQTGAPNDPQPGNLQGQREIMRRELFNDDAAPKNFAADVGTFEVAGGVLNATPEGPGGEAVALYPLDQVQPSYMEILVTINADKDKKGVNSNAYVLFDYQGPQDFKFAGVDVGTDKIQIGHRSAEGWVVDTQIPMQLKPDKDYDLTVVLFGTVATVYVNEADNVSFDFGEPLNDNGYIGLGTDNSVARFDDFQVQKLPPAWTFEDTYEFSDPALNPFTPRVGDWTQTGGRYDGSVAGGDRAITTQFVDVVPYSRLEVFTTLETETEGGLVFDYYNAEDFKFVTLDAVNDQVILGHYDSHGWRIDATADLEIDPGTDYELGVSLFGTSASVTVDGQSVVGFVYNALLNDGAVGLLSRDGSSSFDDVLVRGDDPAYLDGAEGDNLVAAESASASTDATAALSYEALDPIVDEAIARLEESLGAESDIPLAWLESVDFAITDLGGDVLGTTVGTTILLDVDAAGYGWFIDTTPGDDAEFQADPANGLVALDTSDAAGRMDLLTVVMHELGHVLGLDHGDSEGGDDLMSESLDAGERHLVDSTEAQEDPDPVVLISATQTEDEEFSTGSLEAGQGAWLESFLLEEAKGDYNPYDPEDRVRIEISA